MSACSGEPDRIMTRRIPRTPVSASRRQAFRHVLVTFAGASLIAMLGGCATGGATSEQAGKATEGYTQVQDLYIVDCLLPGQVRKLGNMTYLTPRRPVRTTAKDCSIRGGEYVAYDRANYRSALRVWLGRAKAGDAKAQNYVGEIFEKGLGRAPDYVSAAAWYRKAADQGYARAEINLGYLYEKGLGVKQDLATGLNWYRRASGLSGDKLIYQSQLNQAVDDMHAKLQGELKDVLQQVSALNSQISRLKRQRSDLEQSLKKSRADAQQSSSHQHGEEQGRRDLEAQLATAREQITALTQVYSRTEDQRQKLKKKIAGLSKQRSVDLVQQPPATIPLKSQSPRMFRDINFGRYYALIIGDADYRYITKLDTPVNDARAIQKILEQRYGFSTILLANADEKSILVALNNLSSQLTPQDNLLIYYAGHGSLTGGDQGERRRGYWLPINARRDSTVNWLNNAVISSYLDRIQARSILVIADSCYAGAMASDGSALLLGSATTRLTDKAIREGLQHRSRLVISSGGVQPVYDSLGGGQHSMFANALIKALKSNTGVMRDNMLFARVAVNVRRRAAAFDVHETPEMRAIRAAGHAGGDFYFVPRATGTDSGI